MPAVDALSSTTAAGPAQPAPARDRLGQKDFLKLMMTQFSNQDPFKPMDASQFLGQLAQFSTVTGIDDMQTSLASLVDRFKSDQMLSGSALVGREVLVPNDTGALGSDGSLQGAIDVPSGTQQVVVGVRDASGQLVRRIAVPATEGLADFTWDGVTDKGERAPPGRYSFEAVGLSGGGSESLQVLLADHVASVTLDAKTQALLLNTTGHGAVALADVRRIG